MVERENLLASIASTIEDYRAGEIEIAEPTPEHVDRWIRQFDDDVQVPMLRELDYVFKRTYYSKDRVASLLRTLVDHPPNGSTRSHCRFWQRARILDIQQSGRSQSEIRSLFGRELHYHCGLNIDQIKGDGQSFVYLDDAIFSGNRIIQDLTYWIESAPTRATMYICTIVTHTSGEYWCKRHVEQLAADAGKDINLRFWRFHQFENRITWRDSAGQLCPTDVLRPDEMDQRSYNERRSLLFSNVAGRQLLEKEFLSAGARIINSHNEVSPSLKPLGFSSFEPGFGSLVAFYRNCPNNTPLALWWSLGGWYPLFRRKTYEREW